MDWKIKLAGAIALGGLFTFAGLMQHDQHLYHVQVLHDRLTDCDAAATKLHIRHIACSKARADYFDAANSWWR